ncbi:restriction endonuclease subunit S [Enterococcus lactis]|uniref:restriction endonuclease subunit S n=3 Tax=Enterococcus lactis TaxID=357441 RepID=UPI002412390E|nr:restriction endonuclease subunit S [Enterococcus lactis]
MSNDTQPEIRFPGFTGDWEERKLRDITERVRGNDGRMDLPTLTISASSGWLDQRDRFSGNIAGKEQKNYTLLKKGQLSYNHGNSKLAKYGVVCELTTYDEALVPRVYHSFDTNELASSNFIEYMFATKRPDRELAKLVSSGARMDGLLNINFDEFMGINVSVPSVEEQQKIGTFFKQIDDTIALHQRKLDLLKETKKGFLQKMFPKNGAKVPEVRFPGFTEDWEQRKLGELATIVRGASPRPIQDPKWFDTESDVGWLRIADVTEQDGRIYYLEQHISKLGQEKTRVLVEPHLLLSIAATVGKPVLNYVKTGVHDGFLIFLNAIFDREFMFQWLEMFRPKWQKYGQPGSQVNLNSELVRNQEILIPNNEEQQKIGSFFKQLDDTIALHQRELDLLKETKKGFLQKMFV